MNTVTAFSKYIFYSVGGAEKSMYEILKSEEQKGRKIRVVGVDNLKSFNSSEYKDIEKYGWELDSIQMKYQFSRFAYLEYFLNRRSVSKHIERLNNDSELYTYGFYAAAAKGFKGQTKVFLRSETDLGLNENYYSGFKYWLKFFYKAIEFPFYLAYLSDLKKLYSKATLVFNSKWMSDLCFKKFGAKGEIQYPIIDKVSLLKNYESISLKAEKGVVFIGDSIYKGLDLAKEIAKLLPDIKFYFFNRNISSEKVEANIHYMPWSKDFALPYKYAKLVIIPSIWYEAFGRVSVEAQALGLSVLVSNRGGLPETIENKDCIVEDYKNPRVWAEKIKKMVGND